MVRTENPEWDYHAMVRVDVASNLPVHLVNTICKRHDFDSTSERVDVI